VLQFLVDPLGILHGDPIVAALKVIESSVHSASKSPLKLVR
jgi:hypothetical protein